MTFEEATRQYLDSRKLKPQTRRTYETYYHKYLGPHFGNEVIHDIRQEDVGTFFDGLSKVLKPKHANDVLRFARAICKLQIQNAAANPFIVDHGCDTGREQRPHLQPLSRDEISSILQALPNHWRPIFSALAYTGMRLSEVAALKWRDVDWKESVLHVKAVRVKGFESLTAKQRNVSAPSQLLKILRALRQSAEDYSDEKYIFTTPEGHPINRALDRQWKQALAKAGISHRSTLSLRHSYVLICLKAGVAPEHVAAQIGSPLNLFYKRYSDLIPEDIDINDTILSSLF